MRNLVGSLRAVEHQLTHGEASEGDVRDIAWCARQVTDVATALEAALPQDEPEEIHGEAT